MYDAAPSIGRNRSIYFQAWALCRNSEKYAMNPPGRPVIVCEQQMRVLARPPNRHAIALGRDKPWVALARAERSGVASSRPIQRADWNPAKRYGVFTRPPLATSPMPRAILAIVLLNAAPGFRQVSRKGALAARRIVASQLRRKAPTAATARRNPWETTLARYWA